MINDLALTTCAAEGVATEASAASRVEQAQRAVISAERVHQQLIARISAEVDAQRSLIREKHAAEMASALAEIREARLAHLAAQDATPDHPWTGKRVFKMETPRGSRSWDRRPPVRVEGVVETRRSSTPFPANRAVYSIPAVGDPFVRFLKKDGTPAAAFERIYRFPEAWALVDDQSGSAGTDAAQVEVTDPGSTLEGES